MWPIWLWKSVWETNHALLVFNNFLWSLSGNRKCWIDSKLRFLFHQCSSISIYVIIKNKIDHLSACSNPSGSQSFIITFMNSRLWTIIIQFNTKDCWCGHGRSVTDHPRTFPSNPRSSPKCTVQLKSKMVTLLSRFFFLGPSALSSSLSPFNRPV